MMIALASSLSYNIRSIMVASLRSYVGTVDNEELERHNKLANNWWDKSKGPMKALHAMNDLRIPFLITGLINTKRLKEGDCNKAKYLQGIKMIDIGCGGGILTMPLAGLGADITGLDASKELIKVAKDYASKNLKPESTVKFVSSSIEEHSVGNRESYDVVILSEVLEHVSMKEMFLHCCIDVLKPGGSLFITTINRTNISWLSAIVLAENVLKLVPQGTHEWTKLITPNELKIYLANAGCKIIQINGMLYIPFHNSWRWTPLISVNYAVHAIKEIKEI